MSAKKVLFLLGLTACGTQSTTGNETLRFLSASLPNAVVGEAYNSELIASGGTRPFQFSVGSGQLPPGIKLQGTNLSGTPTEAGTFKVTFNVSDANLSRTFREFVLEVKAAPDRQVKLLAPPTEVKDEFKIPVQLTGAKNINGISTAIFLPTDVEFIRVEAGKNQPLIVSAVKDGVLLLDAAFITPSKKNEDITPFTLVFKSAKSLRFDAKIGYEIRLDGKSVAKVELIKPQTLPIQPSTDPNQAQTNTPKTSDQSKADTPKTTEPAKKDDSEVKTNPPSTSEPQEPNQTTKEGESK